MAPKRVNTAELGTARQLPAGSFPGHLPLRAGTPRQLAAAYEWHVRSQQEHLEHHQQDVLLCTGLLKLQT